MIPINYRDPRPIYSQIRDYFCHMILTGGMPGGSKLPSVRDLASQLAINPNTIQRAYRELEADGYIVSITGKGSFVSDQLAALQLKQEQALTSYRAQVQELLEYGVEAETLRSIIDEIATRRDSE